jgi:hypothetical protein
MSGIQSRDLPFFISASTLPLNFLNQDCVFKQCIDEYIYQLPSTYQTHQNRLQYQPNLGPALSWSATAWLETWQLTVASSGFSDNLPGTVALLG